MNKEQFLDELSKTKADWILTTKGMIRSRKGRYCPIMELGKNKSINKAASKIGLNYTLSTSIIYAADHDSPQQLRQELLKATGLL